MKQCSRCLKWKPLDKFSFRKGSRDGLNGHCKSCLHEKAKEWKRAHPFEYLCSNMLTQAKKRARQYEREFDLDYEYIKSIAVSHCPVLKSPLIWQYCHGQGTGDHPPSLDRIDNSKGYIKGNVAIISHKANAMKKNFSAEELRACLHYMTTARSCPENTKQNKKHLPANGHTKATNMDVSTVLALHQQGLSCRKIAGYVNLSKSTIASIIKKTQGVLH